jgi:putative salt-induced outer membrane protein YdiY
MRLHLVNALYCIFLIFFSANVSSADTILLNNGDKISGQILNMSQGEITIETSYAGKISLLWERVTGIISDAPVQVVLNDKTSLYGNLQSTAEGKMRLKIGKIVETLSFNLTEVKAINPKTADRKGAKLSGRIDVGLSKTDGNTETESHHINAQIVARTENNRYTAGFEYNKAKDSGQVTEEDYLGYAKYDHFLTEKWYVYTNTLFEKNEFKDIQLRSTIGAGSGYQFYESELTNLYLEAGFGYVNENFEAAEDSDSVAGRWAVNFDRYLFKEYVQFFHFHEGYQGLEDTKDLFIRSHTGFRFPISNGFQATLQYSYDWDNNPSPGQENYDSKYLFTVGYEFQ